MLLITKDDCSSGARPPDLPLLKALARGHTWFAALVSGRFKSVRELAKQEGVTDRYISRQLTFGFMAPKLVEAVVAQEQRLSGFCIENLRDDQLPLSWHRQCDTTLGKADRHERTFRGNVNLNSTAAEFARTLATKVAADMAEPTKAHMTRSAPSPFGGGKKPHREEERGDATTMSRSLAHGRPGRGQGDT